MGQTEQMKGVVEERGVNSIVHFTKAVNLESIFKHGLLSINDLNNKGIEYFNNDDSRNDGLHSATCFSIQFPNYQYFYRLRINSVVDWAIIILDSRILWEKDCIFCEDNAANGNISSIPLNERRGVKAFKKLFENIEGHPTREEVGIPLRYPTNPQAEVLIPGIIDAQYILAVAFENESTLKKYEGIKPEGMQYIVKKEGFKYRNDYAYWQ